MSHPRAGQKTQRHSTQIAGRNTQPTNKSEKLIKSLNKMAAAAEALENANLALNNAPANAQLTVLPAFSNIEKEDKFTATQWLQKVCLHKEGATWTDAQTVTHFRNAMRNKVVDWYDTL